MGLHKEIGTMASKDFIQLSNEFVQCGSQAAALCVTRVDASDSIPTNDELKKREG